MDIRALKETASARLDNARDAKKIVLIYAGITVGLSALVTMVDYLAGNGISQTGGLGNMGQRAVLSTVQSVLPMLQSVVLMMVELGYINAALRMARGQYASPNAMRMGMDRFFPLVRMTLMQGLLYGVVGMAAFYLTVQLFLLTPFSNKTLEILLPLVSDTTILSDSVIQLDGETTLALAQSMVPLFVMFAIVCAVLFIPMIYQFRMAKYVLIDKPQLGGWAVLKESRKIMRKRCVKLFRLDLSFWWYYLMLFGAGVVCYGDSVLAWLGIRLPLSAEVSFFVFYVLFLIVTLAIYYCFQNRVEVSYALAYEQWKPVEKQENAVVLGNIFQM